MQSSKHKATAANFYVSRFYHLARECGLDSDALLKTAGIPPEIIDVPGERVDVQKLAALVVGICDALQDESMSLASSRVPRGSFYMMGKLTVHELNLHKALLQLQRFFSLITDAFRIHLTITEQRTLLTFDLLDPEQDKDHLFAELNLLMFHRFSCWLIAENIPLIEVFFAYDTPQQIKEYAFLFPGEHVFNAGCMGFSFSNHFLDRPVMQTAGTLKSFMQRCPGQLFLQPKTDFSLQSEIRILLQKRLANENPMLEDVAAELRLNRRTLIRRLKEEGTSFQQIKNLVRRDKAISYLETHTLTMGEIAEKTGFSDPAAFTRAFKAWTGYSPSYYRSNYCSNYP